MPMLSNEDAAARTLTFILAGGEGRRLNPLTRYRPKPLVPFGGCYRILDFTLSNCFNSGLKRLCVHDQGGFGLTRPPANGKRYAGTADAVLQNLLLLERYQCDLALVLSGDQVYRMDYRDLLKFHVESNADATIATVDHPLEFSPEAGVLEVDESKRVVG